MKTTSYITCMMTSCSLILAAANASAAPAQYYAGNVSELNIAILQQSLARGTFASFKKPNVFNAPAPQQEKRTPQPEQISAPRDTVDQKALYGTMSMYGTMNMYGEYGDDGTVFKHGRNGGDASDRPALDHIWTNWQHSKEKFALHDYDTPMAEYNLISIGVSSADMQHPHGKSYWGLFAGFAGGSYDNDVLDTEQLGGYLGAYGSYTIDELNISALANIGVVNNKADINLHKNEDFASFWVSTAADISYDLELSDIFALRPSVYASYTFVKSSNYTSELDDADVKTNGLHFTEVSPAIRANLNLGKGRLLYLGARHAFVYSDNGTVSVNHEKIGELETKDYSEYSVGIEKSIDRFNMGLNLIYHDGGRTGWLGGFTLKYVF